jgi:hypothetical protein
MLKLEDKHKFEPSLISPQLHKISQYRFFNVTLIYLDGQGVG